MLVGLHPNLFTRRAGHVIKAVSCNPLPLQKIKLLFRKTGSWKFLEVKLAYYAVKKAELMENNRSAEAEVG